MNRIEALLQALQAGKKQFDMVMSAEDIPAFAEEELYDFRTSIGSADEEVQMDLFTMPGSGLIPLAGDEQGRGFNRMAEGDNLSYMAWLLREKNMAGKIQLIYVDPPFFTGVKYQSSVQIVAGDGRKSPVLKVGAYEDRWEHDLGAYLEMLAVRFYMMRELLADTGCLWVHLDWHGSHYVKMMLDEIFGPEHFINEVAWTYKSGGASKRSFARKHDTLLFYSRSDHYKFHPLKEKSYNREGKPYHFKGVEEFEDEHGWYTMVNMKDVWSIDMVGRTSGERMGYATQKPEKLLERIVDACTDEGDLCADFFAGTGTLAAVCARRGRPWILCDDGKPAIASQILRMAKLETSFVVERAAAGKGSGSEQPAASAVESAAQPLEPEVQTHESAAQPLEAADADLRPHATDLQPRASVEIAVTDGRLRLVSCRPDLTQIRQQDREIAAEFISANSLDLVSFWSVDTAFDGKVHEGQRLLHGTESVLLPTDMLLTTDSRKFPEDPSPTVGTQPRLSIVGYDLLGGRFSQVIDDAGGTEQGAPAF